MLEKLNCVVNVEALYCLAEQKSASLSAMHGVQVCGCRLTQKDGGISPVAIPKHLILMKKWTDQVKRTRDKMEPTEHSVFCGKNFEHWCFKHNSRLLKAVHVGCQRLWV